jgi:hypothetical protein
VIAMAALATAENVEPTSSGRLKKPIGKRQFAVIASPKLPDSSPSSASKSGCASAVGLGRIARGGNHGLDILGAMPSSPVPIATASLGIEFVVITRMLLLPRVRDIYRVRLFCPARVLSAEIVEDFVTQFGKIDYDTAPRSSRTRS